MSFASCSTDEHINSSFSKGDGTMIKMIIRNADRATYRSISSISSVPIENETMFLKNVRFTVVSKQNKDDHIVITME